MGRSRAKIVCWGRILCWAEMARPCLVWMRAFQKGCGIFQARILDWEAMPSLEGISPTLGSNPHLLKCPQGLYFLQVTGSTFVSPQFLCILGWVGIVVSLPAPTLAELLRSETMSC